MTSQQSSTLFHNLGLEPGKEQRWLLLNLKQESLAPAPGLWSIALLHSCTIMCKLVWALKHKSERGLADFFAGFVQVVILAYFFCGASIVFIDYSSFRLTYNGTKNAL